MDSSNIKIVFLVLMPISIFGQLDKGSGVNPSGEPISARLALDKLEKLRNFWKALCDQLCPQAMITSFILPSRLFSTTKCNRRPSTKSASPSTTTSTPMPPVTKNNGTPGLGTPSSSKPGSTNLTGVSGSSAVTSSSEGKL